MLHTKDKIKFTRRVSNIKVDVVFPPDGAPLILVKFARWQFYTGMGSWVWDEIHLSAEDAKKLSDKLWDNRYQWGG